MSLTKLIVCGLLVLLMIAGVVAAVLGGNLLDRLAALEIMHTRIWEVVGFG